MKGIKTFQNEDATHGKTSGRYRPSQTVIQRLRHLESKFIDFRVRSLNAGTLRGRSREIVEMSECRSVDICWVKETRF